jgi:antitoxin component of MazEF toxin-antitoxin module
MLIRSKLHASQLYIPKDVLEKLAIGKESEITMEFDEDRKVLVIYSSAEKTVPVSWFLDILDNPPETIGGNPEEDSKEYDYNDI